MEVEANIAALDSCQDFLLAKLFCKLCYRSANNETTKVLQIESGSDVVSVHNSFRRRARFALLNIGMHCSILEFSCHRWQNNLGTYWCNLGIFGGA